MVDKELICPRAVVGIELSWTQNLSFPTLCKEEESKNESQSFPRLGSASGQSSLEKLSSVGFPPFDGVLLLIESKDLRPWLYHWSNAFFLAYLLNKRSTMVARKEAFSRRALLLPLARWMGLQRESQRPQINRFFRSIFTLFRVTNHYMSTSVDDQSILLSKSVAERGRPKADRAKRL